MTAAHVGVALGVALAAALPAQRSVLHDLPPEAEAATLRGVGFGTEFEPVVLPVDGPIDGLARRGGTLWVRSGTTLHAVDQATRTVTRRFAAPTPSHGLAADERFLYVLSGEGLVVVDPEAAQVMRTVPVPLELRPLTACAVHAGSALASDGTLLRVVDLRTGAVTAFAGGNRGMLQWCVHDGRRWLGGDGVDVMDLSTGTALQRWPVLVQRSVATWWDGRLLLAVDLAVSPGETRSLVGFLTLPAARARVLRVARLGTALHYEFEGQGHSTLDALQTTLRAFAADPRARGVGQDGRSVPAPVALVAGGGVTVKALREVLEAVVTSGLPDVRCPLQEAWWREQQAAAGRAAVPR